MSFHSPRRRRALAVFFALGAASLAHAAEPLSLAQALRLAEQRSRQLPAQDAATAAARDMAVAAGRRPDPVLKAGLANLPFDGPDRFSLTRDFMTMRSVGVMQELTHADKLRARAARFEREAEASEADRLLALASLQRDTAIAWLDRHYQEGLRALLLRQRDEAQLQVEAADAAYRGGRGAQADVFGARSSLAQIEDRLAQAERDIAIASTRLARWLGPASAAPLAAPPPMNAVPLQAQHIEQQLEHHPQLTRMARQAGVAEAEAEIARTERRPDWSVELMVSQRGAAYSNMASINLSVPLPWDRSRRQDRELAAKLALANSLQAQREEAARTHAAETLAMLQEWHANRQRLARYDTALVPLAGERTQAALAAYRGGTGALTTVLDARRAEIELRTERLRLEMETARLWAGLTYLVPRTDPQGTIE